jgi:hypothetical protein
MIIDERGGSGRSTLGYLNDQGFFYILPAWVVCVECLADGLFRTQHSFRLDGVVGGFPTDYLEVDVGRIDASSERVGVLSQNDISDVVDQVIFLHGDPSSRRAWPFHPYAPLHRYGSDIVWRRKARCPCIFIFV